MSDDVLQYLIIGAIVALAALYLLRQFGSRRRRKGCCGSGGSSPCCCKGERKH